MQPDEEKFEGKVNRCQAPKKKSLKREGAGMREPFHRECFYVTGTHFFWDHCLLEQELEVTEKWFGSHRKREIQCDRH